MRLHRLPSRAFVTLPITTLALLLLQDLGKLPGPMDGEMEVDESAREYERMWASRMCALHRVMANRHLELDSLRLIHAPMDFAAFQIIKAHELPRRRCHIGSLLAADAGISLALASLCTLLSAPGSRTVAAAPYLDGQSHNPDASLECDASRRAYDLEHLRRVRSSRYSGQPVDMP